MAIRLIALDLDGTLFNSRQQISRINQEAVRKTLDSGIQTAIVTGRGRAGAEMALEMLGLDMPYICSAGSLIHSGRDGYTISARTFQVQAELPKIVNFTRRHNSGLIADTLNRNWWFGPDELGADLDPMTAAYAWKSQRTYNPEVDFQQPMLKITLVADHEVLQKAETELCGQCPSLNHVYAGMRYMDLTRHDVNKGSALRLLSGLYKISPKEVAAIGDQPIDLSMLQFAGLPVAMSNAPGELKQASRWIAPSNDEDGVAWTLEKILKEGL